MKDNEYKKKFFELFSFDDLHSIQYALECRYGLNDELAIKMKSFLEEWENERKISN
ncbi:hypothetical protein [Heyndrickxia camelliae]|uniref:hypothetical protein n=1 Tax=Heyndrickxia camelliae TaxID=1707093 RepID=UPI0013FD9225|nr:hypothetical protein [Heyndrickxia camelliae]